MPVPEAKAATRRMFKSITFEKAQPCPGHERWATELCEPEFTMVLHGGMVQVTDKRGRRLDYPLHLLAYGEPR